MSPTNLRSPVWLRLRGALWVPAYLAVFALLEHLPRQHYWATQLPLDAGIPFCPVFVVFYCVWYVLLIGTGLFLLARDGEAFRRYMQFLALTFFLSAAVWFLIPSCQNLRPAQMEESSIFTALLALLYRIDTNTNVFPSAHVGLAASRPASGSLDPDRCSGWTDLPFYSAHQTACPAGCSGRSASGRGGRLVCLSPCKIFIPQQSNITAARGSGCFHALLFISGSGFTSRFAAVPARTPDMIRLPSTNTQPHLLQRPGCSSWSN